jgi:hypothetical protein
VHLVEILLPLTDNHGRPFPPDRYRRVADELTHRFGGLTAFTRAPAEGRWTEGGGVTHDQIVVFEVMTDTLDRAWWAAYRASLEASFQQDEIVIRAQSIERL